MGKTEKSKKAAYQQLLASEDAKKWVQTQLIYAIAILYYELLSLDYEIETANLTHEKQKDVLQIIHYQKDAGKINELVVSQFEAQLLGIQILKNQLEQKSKDIENQILFLCGSLPQNIRRNKNVLNQNFNVDLNIGSYEQFLQQRPDIQEADKLLQASQFQWIASKKAFFPSLNFTSFAASQAFRLNLLYLFPASLAYSLFSSFSTPLINRNNLKALFLSSKSQVFQSFYYYQKIVYQAYYEIAIVYFFLNKQKEIVEFSEKQRDKLNQSVEISKELYKTGEATYLEVLLAQQNALNAQINLIEEKKKLKIAEWNLYKCLGGGR